MLEAIYVMCCLLSPYIYAYFALHGHEEGERTAVWATICFECVFVIAIFKNFITEYTPDGEIIPEKDIMKIAERYFWNEFLIDSIPTIPITFILDMSSTKYGRIFYLVKVIRLAKGLKIYNVQQIMDYLKERQSVKVIERVENDPTLEDNLHGDHNNIEYFFNVRYGLKIFKLFLMIMNVSYFTGIIWVILCEVTE